MTGMGWKVKALVQNAIARLPSRVSYELYYRVQRRFGGLRDPDPVPTLVGGITAWKRLLRQGLDPVGKTFFEVGTGRSLAMPLAYWLMGAAATITVDVNPYLKSALVFDDIRAICRNEPRTRELFGPHLVPERFDALRDLGGNPHTGLGELFAATGIRYLCPADAAATGLPDASVDVHTSFMVFEHIPPEVLSGILAEARRIVKPGGVLVHRIDYSDHFSHSDARISPINFLRYSDGAWARIAGNRYMYQNRLRHDDYVRMFESAGTAVTDVQADTDRRAVAVLANQILPLDERFAGKPREVLAITGAWITARRGLEA